MSSAPPLPPSPPVSSSSSLPPARNYSQLDLDKWDKSHSEAWAIDCFNGYSELLEVLIPLIQKGKFVPQIIEPTSDGSRTRNEDRLSQIKELKEEPAMRAQIISAVEKLLSDRSRDSSSTTSGIDKDFCQFWSQLPSAGLKTPSHLQLVDSFVFGDELLGSSLFVRPCYSAVWKAIVQIFQSRLSNGALVVGNPGIGKSMFMVYVMFILINSPQSDHITIIYEEQLTGIRYLLKLGQVPIRGRDTDSFIEELGNPNNYYLFDCGGRGGREPVKKNCKTIVFSSPDRGHFHNWLKIKRCALFMPVWSAEEVAAACDLGIFSKESKAVYMKRFEFYGGIARSIFDFDSEARTETELTSQVEGWLRFADFSLLLKALKSGFLSMEFPKEGSRLLKFDVPESGPFRSSSVKIDWLSPKLEESFYQLSLAESGKRMVDFLAESAGLPQFSGPRSKAFEKFAHARLSRGGKFYIRPLGKNVKKEVEDVTFDEMKTQPYSDLSTLLPDHYGIPVKLNEPVADAVVRPNRLYQMTISTSHDINNDKLDAIVAQLGNPNVVEYYFVVPEDIFPDFRVSEVPIKLAAKAVKFRQIVLNIPLHGVSKPSPSLLPSAPFVAPAVPSVSLAPAPASVSAAPSRLQPPRGVKRKADP